jgi:23S rRNA pseudouridine2605 synthase
MTTERLSKFLATSGIASRRKSEEIIRSGRVKVNGLTVTDPAHAVDRSRDMVAIDNHAIRPPAASCYVALYKPPGYLSDLADIEGRDRPLARQLIRLQAPLLPVGRLDYNSEGLMIFTNDGAFANLVTHPRYEVEKEYHVKLAGALTQEQLKAAVMGLSLDKGHIYRFKTIAPLNYRGSAPPPSAKPRPASRVPRPPRSTGFNNAEKNTWYRVTVTEGKYHHLRKVAEALSHKVMRLRRVRIDGIRLGDLKPGEWRHIEPEDIKRFLRQQSLPRTCGAGRVAR